MLNSNGNTFAATAGVVIVFGLIAFAIRGALRFLQGFEHGLGVRQKNELQTIFSKDE